MNEFITIASQFNGPPGSHGGYVAGAFADLVDGSAEVTLRPATARPCNDRIARGEDTRVYMVERWSARLSGPSELSLEIPIARNPMRWRARRSGSTNSRRTTSTNASLVVGRQEGDGLRLLTGPVEGSDVVAAHWTPHANFGSEDGLIRHAFCGVHSIVPASGQSSVTALSCSSAV